MYNPNWKTELAKNYHNGALQCSIEFIETFIEEQVLKENISIDTIGLIWSNAFSVKMKYIWNDYALSKGDISNIHSWCEQYADIVTDATLNKLSKK